MTLCQKEGPDHGCSMHTSRLQYQLIRALCAVEGILLCVLQIEDAWLAAIRGRDFLTSCFSFVENSPLDWLTRIVLILTVSGPPFHRRNRWCVENKVLTGDIESGSCLQPPKVRSLINKQMDMKQQHWKYLHRGCGRLKQPQKQRSALERVKKTSLVFCFPSQPSTTCFCCRERWRRASQDDSECLQSSEEKPHLQELLLWSFTTINGAGVGVGGLSALGRPRFCYCFSILLNCVLLLWLYLLLSYQPLWKPTRGHESSKPPRVLQD